MLKEADFAFRQAFAFCPYSPEALFRYVNYLVSPEIHRLDDALLLARTSEKLDPLNASLSDLVNRLQQSKAQRAALNPAQLEAAVRQNPRNFQLALNLASEYFQLGQTGPAIKILDRLLNSTNAPSSLLRTLLQIYTTLSSQAGVEEAVKHLSSRFQRNPTDLEAGLALAEGYRGLRQPQLAAQALHQVVSSPSASANTILQAAEQLVALSDYAGLETALEKLTKVSPGSPESWYNLAAIKALLGKPAESLAALRQALALSDQRHLADPKARDLRAELQHDPRFNSLRSLPDFKNLAAGK